MKSQNQSKKTTSKKSSYYFGRQLDKLKNI